MIHPGDASLTSFPWCKSLLVMLTAASVRFAICSSDCGDDQRCIPAIFRNYREIDLELECLTGNLSWCCCADMVFCGVQAAMNVSGVLLLPVFPRN